MLRRLVIVAGALLVMSLLLAACGEDELGETPTNGSGSPADPTATPSQAPDQPDLDGTSWVLTGFADRDLDIQDPPTIAFADGEVSGFAGCNDFGGQYTTSADGDLELTEIYQTEMDCETGMDIEDEFMQSLNLTQRYAIDDTRLELHDADGNMLLVFMMAEEEPGGTHLDGTAWILDTFNGEPVPEEFEDITLRFDDGQAGGTVCNTYGGTYDIGEDGAIDFSDMFQTEMYCTEPDGLMDLESEYLSALSQDVERYGLDGNTLTLMDGDGEPLMAFTQDESAASSPLEGTSWTVTELDGEPLIEDTEITAQFEEGRINGNGGCNSYGGGYTAEDDGSFNVEEVVSTLMACMDPDGVMDQETAFHTALRESTSYELDGGTLTLLDDSGTARVVMSQDDETDDPDEPTSDLDLDGTDWVLVTMNGEPTNTSLPFTLQFGLNGPTGRAGCVGYWTQFETRADGTISHSSPQASTYDGACDDDDVRAEGEAYVETLRETASYAVIENNLHLMDEAGETTLEFRPGFGGADLEGTSWVLTSLNGDDPITGADVTLEFEENRTSGNSGCNGYGGHYMVIDPGTVSILDVEREEQGCTEPEGIMEQESAYFDALNHALDYILTDDSLTLMNADGETIMTFEPAS